MKREATLLMYKCVQDGFSGRGNERVHGEEEWLWVDDDGWCVCRFFHRFDLIVLNSLRFRFTRTRSSRRFLTSTSLNWLLLFDREIIHRSYFVLMRFRLICVDLSNGGGQKFLSITTNLTHIFAGCAASSPQICSALMRACRKNVHMKIYYVHR